MAFHYALEGDRHEGGRCDCVEKKAVWKIGKYEYVGCPEQLLEDTRTMQWIELWTEWKMFGLRYPGTYGEQPVVYIDVLKELEAESRTVKVRNGA
jgi:hypothetical protein